MITAEDIQQPMAENTDYFDATAAILALTLQVEQLQAAMVNQLSINQKILKLLGERGEEPKQSLILPERFN